MQMPKKAHHFVSCAVAILVLAACDASTEKGPIIAEKELSNDKSGPKTLPQNKTKNDPDGRFARMALDCVNKQYPNKISHVLNSAKDVKSPQSLYPAFYGCFDWHSSVHGHWLLTRLWGKGEVSELDDVFLYTVDDLAQVVTDGIENRQEAAITAESIVEARVQSFMQWLHKRNSVPTIKALRDQAEAMRAAELEKAIKLIQKGERPEKALEMLSLAITNKFLHAPSHALNQSHGDEHERLEQLFRHIYQIKN